MQVVLTDYLEAILINLRACVHLNVPASASSTSTPSSGGGSAAAVEAAAADAGGTAAAAEEPAHAAGAADELFDPEDASECSDLDDFFSEAAACQGGQEGRQPAQQQQSWDVVSGEEGEGGQGLGEGWLRPTPSRPNSGVQQQQQRVRLWQAAFGWRAESTGRQ